MLKTLLQPYFFSLLLIFSIILGGWVGLSFESVAYLKPLGEMFLNLLFTVLVPFIFFSVSAAIVRTLQQGKLGKIIFAMTLVFLVTGLIASTWMLLGTLLFPPMLSTSATGIAPYTPPAFNLGEQIAHIFTVNQFYELFSHQHSLALIAFAILVGVGTSSFAPEHRFNQFLTAGEQVFMRVFQRLMCLAPIGFFAYFAVMIHDLGPSLLHNYLHILSLYYIAGLLYFVLFFSLYVYVAGKNRAVRLFWQNISMPAMTAIATCSSAASIPANLLATQAMQIPSTIVETTIPLGTFIHKEGSVLGGIIKIVFLFGLFHQSFTGWAVYATAVILALLVGTVMGAIPSGGMLGELLILNFYGFPPSALMAVAAISILIDPLATLLNVTGNSASSFLITRLVHGRQWLPLAKSTRT